MPQTEDLASSLIRRSTGPLGDFKMPICSQIIANENLSYQLPPEQVTRILLRYKQHVIYWGTAFNTTMNELAGFANAMRQNPDVIKQQFLSI